MLLQVMSLALNVCHDSLPSSQLDTRDFPLRRVGFLGLHYKNLGADTLSLRADLE